MTTPPPRRYHATSPGSLVARRTPLDAHPARGLGPTAGGHRAAHTVLPLDRPPGMVGRLRLDRARAVPGVQPGRTRGERADQRRGHRGHRAPDASPRGRARGRRVATPRATARRRAPRCDPMPRRCSWPPAITRTTPRSCADPDDLPEVCAAVVESPRGTLERATEPWDVIDLRRLRDDDPALPALDRRVPRRPGGLDGAAGAGGRVPGGDAPRRRLGRLPRDARQEGPPRDPAQDPPRRGRGRHHVPPDAARCARPWTRSSTCTRHAGASEGLFPDTEGGDRSRRFLHRLTELEAAEGDRASSSWARCRRRAAHLRGGRLR